MIRHDKLFALLKEKGYTTNRLRNGTGGLDARTINRLCVLLSCQPGDLMTYVSDDG